MKVSCLGRVPGARVCGFAAKLQFIFLAEKADVKTIFTNGNYSHPYTEGLMLSIPRLDTDKNKKLEPIPGSVPNPLYLPEGCKFAPRCKYCTEKCMKEEPQLVEVEANHSVRCFYAEKVVRSKNGKG